MRKKNVKTIVCGESGSGQPFLSDYAKGAIVWSRHQYIQTSFNVVGMRQFGIYEHTRNMGNILLP